MSKKPKNYFEFNIERHGANFMAAKNPEQIKREALRIFKDLSSGKVEPKSYSQYILNKVFLTNTMAVAYAKSYYYNLCVQGVGSIVHNSTNPNQLQVEVLNDLQHREYAFSLMYDLLKKCNDTNSVDPLSLGLCNLVPLNKYFIN